MELQVAAGGTPSEILSIPAFVHPIIYYLVEYPLMLIYLHGPAFGVIGFWQGKTMPDICSSVTAVDAAHWEINKQMCADLIRRKLNGFIVFVCIVWYFLTLVYLQLLFMRCCFARFRSGQNPQRPTRCSSHRSSPRATPSVVQACSLKCDDPSTCAPPPTDHG